MKRADEGAVTCTWNGPSMLAASICFAVNRGLIRRGVSSCPTVVWPRGWEEDMDAGYRADLLVVLSKESPNWQKPLKGERVDTKKAREDL